MCYKSMSVTNWHSKSAKSFFNKGKTMKLTEAQELQMRVIRGKGEEGLIGSISDPTLLALERKGMIERKPYQDHTRIALWFEKKVDQTSQSS